MAAKRRPSGEREPRPAPSDSSLRRTVLDAALAMVERAGGLQASLEHLSLEQVIKESGVPRASAYREWPNKAAFHLDLMCELAGPNWQGTAAFDADTIRVAMAVVADRLHLLHTPQGRRAVLMDAARQGAEQNFRTVTTSAQWRSYVTLSATLLSLPEQSDRDRVRTALEEAERTFIGRMARFYEVMAIILGVRLRPWVPSFLHVAAAGAAGVEGLGLRNLLTPDLVGTPLHPEGPDGEPWSLAAVGFFAILDRMIEVDPDYDPTLALTRYLKEQQPSP